MDIMPSDMQKVECPNCHRVDEIHIGILIEGESTVCPCGHITNHSITGGVMSEAPKGAIYMNKPTYQVRLEVYLERSGPGWEAEEKVLPCEKRCVSIEIPRDQLENLGAWINAAGQTMSAALNSMARAEHERFQSRVTMVKP